MCWAQRNGTTILLGSLSLLQPMKSHKSSLRATRETLEQHERAEKDVKSQQTPFPASWNPNILSSLSILPTGSSGMNV